MIICKADRGREKLIFNCELGLRRLYLQYLRNPNNMIPFWEGYVVYTDETSQDELAEFIGSQLRMHPSIDALYIYTDIPENKLVPLKFLLKKMEKHNNFETFLACRHEDWSD